MRQIKYRQSVFDSKGKHSSFMYWGFLDTGFWEPFYDDNNGINDARERSEQFTGVLDKNGKEIYEHDKVEDKFGNVSVVVYDEILAAFTSENPLQGCKVVGNIHEGK